MRTWIQTNKTFLGGLKLLTRNFAFGVSLLYLSNIASVAIAGQLDTSVRDISIIDLESSRVSVAGVQGIVVSEGKNSVLEVPESKSVLFVLVGGGGGGSGSMRSHQWVRTGAGGSSAELTFATADPYPINLMSNGKKIGQIAGVQLNVALGPGGRGGYSQSCRPKPNAKLNTAGEAGKQTVLKIWKETSETAIFEPVTVTSNGGSPGRDFLNLLTTCYGACEKNGSRNGFTLQIPPLGGIGAGISTAGADGIDNISIVRGETILPSASGGLLREIPFGRGGNGGGYNATRGSVTQPPGNNYAPSDYVTQCKFHPETRGMAGSKGGVVAIFATKSRIPEIQAQISSAVQSTSSDGTWPSITQLANAVRAHFAQFPTNFHQFPNTRSQIKSGGDREIVENYLSELNTELEKGSKPENLIPDYQEAGSIGLYLKIAVVLIAITHDHVLLPGSDLDKDFSGVELNTIEEELKLLENNISAVKHIIKNIPGANLRFNHDIIAKLSERRNKLLKEIGLRRKKLEEARIKERVGRYGGASLMILVLAAGIAAEEYTLSRGISVKRKSGL